MGSNHRPLSYQDSVLPLNYTLKQYFNDIENITEIIHRRKRFMMDCRSGWLGVEWGNEADRVSH